MLTDNFKTAVVYLAWLPSGIGHFKTFIGSYQTFKASHPHQLIIAFNGLAADYPDKPDAYIAYLDSCNLTSVQYFYVQHGQDIEVYKQVAKEADADYILFFNTYSRIQAANWLKYYIDNFSDGVGVIGATGSFQSYYSTVYQQHTAGWEKAKGFLYNFRKYKLFIKTFFYWRLLFKPFPNPHIRTNAFMIKRTTFLEIRSGAVNTKFKAYQFESGRQGLTAFFLAKGLHILVLDKFGQTFEQAAWKESTTFWVNNQENLLISDNQTRQYAAASQAEKEKMTRLAWGKK